MTEHIFREVHYGYTDGTALGRKLEKQEEIVRCRDCKRFHPEEGQMLSCKFEYKGFVQWRNAEPDGFCAWAKKKG